MPDIVLPSIAITAWSPKVQRMGRPLPLLAAVFSMLPAACGSDDEPFDGPCPTLTGAWSFKWTERAGGSCEVGTLQTVFVFGGAPSAGAVCTRPPTISADGCEVLYDQTQCTDDDGIVSVLTGTIHFTAANRLGGVLQLGFMDGSDRCQSVFDVVATPI